MILLRILESPARREVASLGEIACAVGSPPDAVREMLHTLARRGRVQPTAAQAVCGLGCRQCVQQDLGFDCPGGDDAK